MPDLTPELNLNLALDDDDTADYLTVNLSDSLTVLDGLFNSSTGHAHNGAHQGGSLEFLDLLVGEDLTVMGQTDLKGPLLAESNLHVIGLSTLDGAVTAGSTLHVVGAATLDAGLSVTGSISATLDLTVGRNASITGTLSTGALTVNGGITATGTLRGAGFVAPNGGGFAARNAANSADNTMLWLDSGNQTVLMAGAGNGIRLVNSANSAQWAHWDTSGNYIQDAGAIYVGGDRVVQLAAAQSLTNKIYVNAKDTGPSGVMVNANDLTNYMMVYGAGTFTLPTPSAVWGGVFRAVKAWGGAVTVNCAAAVLAYPGGTSMVAAFGLLNGDSVTCWCDGTYWWVL